MSQKSRRSLPPGVRAYAVTLRGLARVAPAIAERELARRFCTPIRRRRRPAADVYDRADAITHAGRSMPVWRGGAGPRVLLAHGWDSHGAFWDPVARALVKAGHQVVTADLPAHGHADGRRTSVFELADALGALARAHAPLAAVVGHSAGAAAAALALADGLAAGRAVLVSPPARPADFMFPLAATLGLTRPRALGALEVMRRRFGRDPFEADTLAAVAELRLPGLVIHDHDDARALWSDGRAIADAWHGARLVSTRGLGHYRLAHDPGVIAEIVGFVTDSSGSARLIGREEATP